MVTRDLDTASSREETQGNATKSPHSQFTILQPISGRLEGSRRMRREVTYAGRLSPCAEKMGQSARSRPFAPRRSSARKSYEIMSRQVSRLVYDRLKAQVVFRFLEFASVSSSMNTSIQWFSQHTPALPAQCCRTFHWKASQLS
jgi:hypothetical protein